MLKNEAEIISSWDSSKYDLETPIVSVCTFTYNHEEYIGRAIESFLSQITEFPFEIVIHDDSSTDCTASIIEEYKKKYPKIIKAFYEDTNQLSIDPVGLKRNMIEWMRGEYIALCEGDDYWCDNYKLQIQYEYIISHPDCSLCCHNTIIHDLSENKQDSLFYKWEKEHALTQEEVFFDWNIHTSSYFYRKNDFDVSDEYLIYWCGDFVRATYLFTKGKIYALPRVMSVYNWNNQEGVTQINNNNIQIKRRREIDRVEYLEKLNILSEYHFKDVINNKIIRTKLLILTYSFETTNSKMSYIEFKSKTKLIKNDDDYKNAMKILKISEKVKLFLKYNFYFVYQINRRYLRR